MHVVGVAPAEGAAREAAASVAGSQGAADRWRNRARLAAHIEHSAVGVVTHVHQRRVARQALRRFHRNVQGAVIDFEGTIEGDRCRGGRGRLAAMCG